MDFLSEYRMTLHQLYKALQKAREAHAEGNIMLYNNKLIEAGRVQYRIDELEVEYYSQDESLFDPNLRTN